MAKTLLPIEDNMYNLYYLACTNLKLKINYYH